jgi:hypothetical protein
MKDKKPFKESKLGKFLSEKAPKILDVVGDVLPDKGVLGIVKNLIDKDPEIPAEQKLEFEKLLQDHEKEMYALDTEDRHSARTREVELAKVVGHSDYMVWFLAIALMISFGFIVWHLIRDGVPNENRELVTNIVGIIEGLLISIYSYYFGSSMGSRLKDMSKR